MLGLRWGRPLAVDATIAAASAALLVARFMQPAADRGVAGDAAWALPLLLVSSVALLWRRERPVLCVAGVLAPVALHAALTGHGTEGLFEVLPVVVALFSLGSYATGRRLLAGTAVAAALVAVHDTNDPAAFPDEASTWAYLFWTSMLLAALLAGVVTGSARRAGLARRQAAEEESHRQEALASERAKIARELHDVVTHSMNVVVLQAMAAEGVLGSDPERVRQPLKTIESSGREALAELRRMLGVLRDDDEVLLTPSPGVHDVARLVESLRCAGEDVECTVTGDVDRLPEGMGLVVFRIVQEALTNTVKYARGGRVRVRVHSDHDGVEVDVVNDAGSRAPDASGAGHGLVGMAERAALFGGSVDASPTATGGFRVRATLPTPASSAP